MRKPQPHFQKPCNRVDETGHDHGEGQEGPQLHALGNGTGDHPHAGGSEHDLEEEIGASRVVWRIVATSQHGIDGVLVTNQEAQTGKMPPSGLE